MDVRIVSRRATKQQQKLAGEGFVVIDVTSKAPTDYVKFSPFYPHGNIPVPGMDAVSESVEGVWQGLKILEGKGTDNKKFSVKSMKGLKRCGKVLGHKYGDESLEYVNARKRIYVPTYQYVLDTYMQKELNDLRRITKLVLLDYDTNENVDDTSKPLSHASLIKKTLMAY
jgi:hypothetical protein